MRRIEMYQRINRNNTAVLNDAYTSPLCVNMIQPEISGKQNWVHHDMATGMDIIELNDSDVSETEETPRQNLSHAWSYTNTTIPSNEGSYRANRKARERRRLKNDDRQSIVFSPNEYAHYNNSSNSNDVTARDCKSNVRLNHQINCFTIINKHFINSDTSSENTDYDNVDQSRLIGDGLKENEDYNNVFGEETLTYNSDCDAEKRTIWIYSFKNKRLLSDDCFEMVNIPSTETESCTSFSFEKFEEDTDSTTRAASPIPPPYIPRLNLSLGQTLSTVTEVTEPNKQPSSVETERLAKVPIAKKHRNTWIINNSNDSKDCENNQENSTNVVNWMALSPRQRRRIFREKDSNSDVYKGKLATLQEMRPKLEKKIVIGQDKSVKNEMYNDVQSNIVDVDVHVTVTRSSDAFKAESKRDSTSNRLATKQDEIFADENIVEVITDDENIQEINNCPRKPQIKIRQKSIRNTRNITDPLEMLNTDNWIVEEIEEQTTVYSYDLERTAEGNSNEGDYVITENDRLWSKNAIALMKPAQWNEYAPVADSHLSLHLSLDSTIRKQTWLSRLISLFKCCN